MAQPFSEVAAELPTVLPEERRDHKTINRELSTMAIVAKHLATTSWHPRVPSATVLNFGAARIATKNGADFDTRPPWTTAHLEMLFNSPIYIGNGGALRRLRASDDNGSIWHDAAYFAPLLWFYHHTCREETCARDRGLAALADSVSPDHSPPPFALQNPILPRRALARDRTKGRFQRQPYQKVFPSSVNAAR